MCAVRMLLIGVLCLASAAPGCGAPPTSTKEKSEEHTYRIVVATDRQDRIPALNSDALPGIQVIDSKRLPGKKREPLTELHVRTKKKLKDVLDSLRAVPGVEGAALVAAHRYRLVVQFEKQLPAKAASQKLHELSPLLVSTPGKMKKSPYFEVLIESNDSLEKVIASAEAVEDVVLAEPNMTYQAQ